MKKQIKNTVYAALLVLTTSGAVYAQEDGGGDVDDLGALPIPEYYIPIALAAASIMAFVVLRKKAIKN